MKKKGAKLVKKNVDNKKRTHWSIILILSFLVVFLVSSLGSVFTNMGSDSQWYKNIKPAITPPDQLFGVIWTILFFLVAVSLFLVWKNSKDEKDRKKIVVAYGMNFILNIAWSALFFGLYSPSVAFMDIILLWISILWMMQVSFKIDKKALYLLIPYLLWVTFAAYLNWLSI